MGIIISIFYTIYNGIFGRKQKTNGSKYEVEDGVTLFTNGSSPCARRVRIMLYEKQIPFKLVNIDLLKGEQYNEEYLFVNPNRKVPAIAFKNVQGITDGFYYESNVITELLDSIGNGNKLYSSDPNEKAEIRMWQDYELGLVDDFVPLVYWNAVGFILRILFDNEDDILEKVEKNTPEAFKLKLKKNYSGSSFNPEQMKLLAIGCYQNLLPLENRLKKRTYLVGNRFTAADLSVFPRLDMFEHIGLPISHKYFPNIYKWLQLIGSRSSVRHSVDTADKFMHFLLTYMSFVIVGIGNVKSGGKFKRFDGNDVIDKAINEASLNPLEIDELKDLDDKETVVIVDYPVSTDCIQIQLLMNLLGIKYKSKPAHILNVIGRAAGSGGIYNIYHNKINIKGMRAILEYICAIQKESKLELLPSDPIKRAYVQSWQAWEQTMYYQEMAPLVEKDILSKVLVFRYENNLEELLMLRSDPVYHTKFNKILTCFMAGLSEDSQCWLKLKEDYNDLIPDGRSIQTQVLNNYQLLHTRLQHLDNTLIHQDYLVGNSMTLADICVCCRLILFPFIGMKISVNKYPHVSTWLLKMNSNEHVSEITDSLTHKISIL